MEPPHLSDATNVTRYSQPSKVLTCTVSITLDGIHMFVKSVEKVLTAVLIINYMLEDTKVEDTHAISVIGCLKVHKG